MAPPAELSNVRLGRNATNNGILRWSTKGDLSLSALNLGISQGLFHYLLHSIETTPFYTLLGIKLRALGEGYAELELVASEQHCNPLGVVHGGIYMTLADAAMGNAIRSLGIKGMTVDCSTAFISAVQFGETLLGKGQILRAGKNMLFARAQIFGGERLLADSKATFFSTGRIEFE